MAQLGEPEMTPETVPFWEGMEQRELRMQRCSDCERFYFFPRLTCRFCHSPNVEWRALSGKATLLSYVINRRPIVPQGASEPQVIAIIEVDEGPRMLTNIVGTNAVPEELILDSKLTVDFEERCGRIMPVFRITEVAA